MRRATWLLLATMAARPASAFAGGFAIETQGASSAGNANAGTAAGEDASTIFFNPAGLMRLHGSQFVLGGTGAWLSSNFTDHGSTGASANGNDGGNGGGFFALPNFYWVQELSSDWKVGVGINEPFGLSTSYASNWAGRFIAIDSEVRTVNINPSAAYRVCPWLSLGAGFDVQTFDAKLTSDTGVPAIGNSRLTADDLGYGYNLGAMFEMDDQTRVGVSYRSRIEYRLDGEVHGSGPAAPSVFDGPIHSDLTVPDSASIGAFHGFGSSWDVMADVTWTHWSTLDELHVVRSDTGASLTTIPFHWSNTWRYSLGTNWKPADRWKLRAGVAYDPTPSNDATRTPRLPDADRIWLALGGQLAVSSNCLVDLSYVHEFASSASIHQDNPAPVGGQLNGTFHNQANVVMLQVTLSY